MDNNVSCHRIAITAKHKRSTQSLHHRGQRFKHDLLVFFLAVENVFTSACLTFCDADGLYLLYSALNIHCNTNINICRHRTNDGLLLEELLFAFATKLNQLCARLQFILSNLFNDIFPIDLNVNGS